MSEAAATPAPELPLTLEELVAAHNALLARLIAEESALRRSLDAAKMSPARMMTDVMLIEALNRIADVQGRRPPVVVKVQVHVLRAASAQHRSLLVFV